MRGYPLLQLLLVVCLFAAAGFPVWRLTRPAVIASAPTLPPAASATPAGETLLDVRVTFSPAPAEFRLSYLGRIVLEGHGPQAEFGGTVRAALPPEGADLALEARFAAAPESPPVPAAVRVRCQFPDGHTTEKTLWGNADRPLVELVTVTP